MLHTLSIQGYRSLLDLHLKLAPLTIVQGANGVGKSNLYRALQLFAALAEGRFPETIAKEGGMPSCLHAANPRGPRRPKTIALNLGTADFDWQISFGLRPVDPKNPTAFRTDPELKKESLLIDGTTYHRKQWSHRLPPTESILCSIRDKDNHSSLALVREQILSWRFYDHFRTDSEAPLRKPSPCFWSPVLHQDGSNLAAALQSISESFGAERLSEIVALAFPDHHLTISGAGLPGLAELALEWHLPDLLRPLSAHELSDGTLRFLALAAALLAPAPPSLLVLNEPENSLNPSLFPALARLIDWAQETSQIIVITHSQELAEQLQSSRNRPLLHELALQNGATRLAKDLGPRQVWNFE